jgi:hypothetical protein
MKTVIVIVKQVSGGGGGMRRLQVDGKESCENCDANRVSPPSLLRSMCAKVCLKCPRTLSASGPASMVERCSDTRSTNPCRQPTHKKETHETHSTRQDDKTSTHSPAPIHPQSSCHKTCQPL